MKRRSVIALLATAAFVVAGCGDHQVVNSPTDLPVPARTPTASKNQSILFLEDRVKKDPDDFIAYNKLAAEYLRRMRETGDLAFLDLALTAANRSLSILTAEQNPGGLAALAQAEFSSHNFADARDHAIRLTEIDPGKAYVYQLLGDAHLELGQYDEAKAAFTKMEGLGAIQALNRMGIEQRLARVALLYGDPKKALTHMTRALQLAERPPGGSAETIAWCKWQLGEIAMNAGDYEMARKYFVSALETMPDYFPATEALGHVSFALGDLPGAIETYEKIVATQADPGAVAMLGDLYKKAAREEDAARQYDRMIEIARIDAAEGNLHSREFAMYFANHGLNVLEACETAKKAYETRRDIYGADTFAWACYKAGRLDEARAAIREALRLGTKDAQLFYHAGMIEKALGNRDSARKQLQSSIKLHPGFDPLQADVARSALEELR